MKKRFALLAAMATLLGPIGSAAEAEEVNFITDFGFNGRHSYYYVALEKGYYADAGIELNILRGQGSADAIKKVASGAAEIGFADTGSLVLARGNDGVPVKMVSVVYATPPQAIYVLADSGIESAKDLEGKTVADTASSSVRLLFPAYAEAAGIDAAKVNWVAADGSALASILATGRADGIGQFVVGQALLQKAAAPKEVKALAFKDAGLSFYSNGIIASEETIASKPELVKAFVAATLKGMKDAFSDPKEAAEIMHKYQKQIDPVVIEGETKMVMELANANSTGLGKIDPAKVQETVDVVGKYFKLNADVDPAAVYAEGFVE